MATTTIPATSIPTPDPPDIDRTEPDPPLIGTLYLRKQDLARLLRLTERQVQRLHEGGNGPPRFRIGKRLYYSREGVLAWLKSLEEPTSTPRRRKKTAAV